MVKSIGIIIVIISVMSSCDSNKSDFQKPNATETKQLSEESLLVRDLLTKDIVIAHRGTTYWAPESTEPAFRWARNIGSDYLEIDLQMTKDSVLVVTHDDYIMRTSNVIDIFPEVENPTTNDFTLKELRTLDFGSWFNNNNPERAKESYVDTKILTFKDVVMIAEGYHLKKENGQPVKMLVDGEWNGEYVYEIDPSDNKNRPGIYAETKKLHLEKLLLKELKEYQWLITDNPKKIKTFSGKVGYANTDARFILQTFHRESITQLDKYLAGIPKCLLIWRPDIDGEIKNSYLRIINYCVDNNVVIIGPSISTPPNNYDELSEQWMTDLIHKSGIIVHPYTFDNSSDFDLYKDRFDGVFTNRADLALLYYGRIKNNIAEKILEEL